MASLNHIGPDGRVSGLDPERRTYRSRALFHDPDGNVWLLQEITARLPGRVDSGVTSFSSASDLASALRRAAAAHGEHEKRIGAAMRTGQTGTPSTWRASSPAKRCRNKPTRMRSSSGSMLPGLTRKAGGYLEEVMQQPALLGIQKLLHVGMCRAPAICESIASRYFEVIEEKCRG